jgi:hypothetical protein
MAWWRNSATQFWEAGSRTPQGRQETQHNNLSSYAGMRTQWDCKEIKKAIRQGMLTEEHNNPREKQIIDLGTSDLKKRVHQ